MASIAAGYGEASEYVASLNKILVVLLTEYLNETATRKYIQSIPRS
jgi:hypothetical protein